MKIEPSWDHVLKDELSKPYIADLELFVENQRLLNTPVYPPKDLVFSAFKLTPFNQVKVLIVGQDPYHGAEQAEGLAFSVPDGIKLPPSLKNIFKELQGDIGGDLRQNGSLVSWAKQGVLLLNATLTVRDGDPMSHHGKGWELLTDAVIRALCERDKPVIFVLWGNLAKEKYQHIESCKNAKIHYVLTAAHPSPFSARRGFFGCQHFSKINQILRELGDKEINWLID